MADAQLSDEQVAKASALVAIGLIVNTLRLLAEKQVLETRELHLVVAETLGALERSGPLSHPEVQVARQIVTGKGFRHGVQPRHV